MHVIAAPAHQVPRQEKPHQHIEPAPAEPIEVPDTSYYRRRIAAGELLLAKMPRAGAKQPAKDAAE